MCRVGILSRAGHWYKSGSSLVPIRWVFMRDRNGTYRDEFLFSTDPTLDPRISVATSTRRWNLETTFQELRAWLGLETTRGCCRDTVLRLAPCLFGLYTVMALLYQALPESKRVGRMTSMYCRREIFGRTSMPSPSHAIRALFGINSKLARLREDADCCQD